MNNKPSNTNSNQMIWLDILRIFACFSVVAVHVSIVFNIPGRIGHIMEAGSNGLGIFYILSGFLAFYSLDKYEGAAIMWIRKRLLRILPMYYFAILSFIIVYEFILKSAPDDPNSIKWLSYVLGINTILKKGPDFWYNIGALSSMSVFMWFYIFAPGIRKVINSWEKSMLFLVFSYCVLRALQYTEYLTMFRAYYYFAIGIVVYYAVTDGKEKHTSLVFLTVIMFLILADSRGGLLYGLVVGIFIIVSHDMEVKNETIVKIILFISKRTFAIYIAHSAIIQIVTDTTDVLDTKCMCMVAVLSVAGIIVLYEGVERGTKYLLKKRINKE